MSLYARLSAVFFGFGLLAFSLVFETRKCFFAGLCEVQMFFCEALFYKV